MNNIRRKALKEALDYIEKARLIVEEIAVDEQDSFDNLPEGLQMSERGEQMELNASNLDEANDILGEVIDTIWEMI